MDEILWAGKFLGHKDHVCNTLLKRPNALCEGIFLCPCHPHFPGPFYASSCCFRRRQVLLLPTSSRFPAIFQDSKLGRTQQAHWLICIHVLPPCLCVLSPGRCTGLIWYAAPNELAGALVPILRNGPACNIATTCVSVSQQQLWNCATMDEGLSWPRA